MCTTYSLKARIVPRVRALKSKGLMATAFKDPAFKVTYVMCASDARFCAMAEMEREKYDELVKQAKEDPDAGKIGWLTDGRRDENERNDETSARDKKKRKRRRGGRRAVGVQGVADVRGVDAGGGAGDGGACVA
jgi:hypothetical protein